MDILYLNFTLFSYCGLWWTGDTGSLKYYFHRICMCLTLTILYTFTLTELLDTIFGNYDKNEMTNNLFMLLTMISVCCKVTNFVFRRQSIAALLCTLREDNFRTQNHTEAKIQKDFNAIARSDTIYYAVLAAVTVAGFVISPIFAGSYERRLLPFKAWLPYSLSSLSLYWATYVQQSVSLIIAANLNVATDTLISGFLVQVCAQLDILKERIENIAKPFVSTDDGDRRVTRVVNPEYIDLAVKECVRHHDKITKFAATVQSIFSWVVFFQFFVTGITVCSSVYKLSQQHLTGMEIATLMCYLGCILLQLLFYCWHGNQVKLKSLSVSDAVYGAEWTVLRPTSRKCLTMIMARSNIPIQITCGVVLTLSLETYMLVLRASYSTFNLLKNS